MAVKVNELKPGLVIQEDGALWQIVEIDHVKPGKGPAYYQIRKKNLDTGRLDNDRYNSGKAVDLVQIEARKLEYGWPDGEQHVFMDAATYEQILIPAEVLGDRLDYLTANQDVTIRFHGSRPVQIDLPGSVELRIVETEPGTKGDTVNNVLKSARLETGLEIKVPLHINAGDLVKINTTTGDFLGRSNK